MILKRKMVCAAALVLALAVTVSGQRPGFAGFRPIGFPELYEMTTAVNDLGDRFGEVNGTTVSTTTQRLPLEANGDRNLVDRLSKLPIDKQPFWLINWQALEQNRQQPQFYPQRPNPFLDSNPPNSGIPISGTPNSGIPISGTPVSGTLDFNSRTPDATSAVQSVATAVQTQSTGSPSPSPNFGISVDASGNRQDSVENAGVLSSGSSSTFSYFPASSAINNTGTFETQHAGVMIPEKFELTGTTPSSTFGSSAPEIQNSDAGFGIPDLNSVTTELYTNFPPFITEEAIKGDGREMDIKIPESWDQVFNFPYSFKATVKPTAITTSTEKDIARVEEKDIKIPESWDQIFNISNSLATTTTTENYMASVEAITELSTKGPKKSQDTLRTTSTADEVQTEKPRRKTQTYRPVYPNSNTNLRYSAVTRSDGFVFYVHPKLD